MTTEFAGKVALVTGASSGIGRATAMAFAHAGAYVVVADRDVERGSAVVREIGEAARFAACDVTREADCVAAVDVACDTWGRLDAAFNNAGVGGELVATADTTEAAFRRVLDVNLVGAFLCMKAEIRAMRARAGGAIVNCASILAHVGFANAAAYVASKHALVGLTKAAALEYATHAIRVNAICPGFVETPMLASAGLLEPTARHDLEKLHPVKRLGMPEEIAAAVLFLASPRASFVTGTTLLADGGYVAS